MTRVLYLFLPNILRRSSTNAAEKLANHCIVGAPFSFLQYHYDPKYKTVCTLIFNSNVYYISGHNDTIFVVHSRHGGCSSSVLSGHVSENLVVSCAVGIELLGKVGRARRVFFS